MNGYRLIVQTSLHGYYAMHRVALRENSADFSPSLFLAAEEATKLADYRAATTRPPLWAYDAHDFMLWRGLNLIE